MNLTLLIDQIYSNIIIVFLVFITINVILIYKNYYVKLGSIKICSSSIMNVFVVIFIYYFVISKIDNLFKLNQTIETALWLGFFYINFRMIIAVFRKSYDITKNYTIYLSLITIILLLILSFENDLIRLSMVIFYSGILISLFEEVILINSKKVENSIKKDIELYRTRNNEIENILSYIDNYHKRDTYAISINAKWGQGKTTLLNATIDKLKKTGYECIHIDPMLSYNKEELFNQFYLEINSLLVKNDLPTISDSLITSHLKHITNSYVKNKIGIEVLNKKVKSLNDIRTRVEALISILLNKSSKDNKKIIIAIDDFDRVDERSIRDILGFVNHITLFKGFLVVFVYDHENLNRAMNSGIKYMEKFIDKHFDISPILIDEAINYRIKQECLNNSSLSIIFQKNNIWDTLFKEFKKIDTNYWCYNLRNLDRLIDDIFMYINEYREFYGETKTKDYSELIIKKLILLHFYNEEYFEIRKSNGIINYLSIRLQETRIANSKSEKNVEDNQISIIDNESFSDVRTVLTEYNSFSISDKDISSYSIKKAYKFESKSKIEGATSGSNAEYLDIFYDIMKYNKSKKINYTTIEEIILRINEGEIPEECITSYESIDEVLALLHNYYRIKDKDNKYSEIYSILFNEVIKSVEKNTVSIEEVIQLLDDRIDSRLFISKANIIMSINKLVQENNYKLNRDSLKQSVEQIQHKLIKLKYSDYAKLLIMYNSKLNYEELSNEIMHNAISLRSNIDSINIILLKYVLDLNKNGYTGIELNRRILIQMMKKSLSKYINKDYFFKELENMLRYYEHLEKFKIAIDSFSDTYIDYEFDTDYASMNTDFIDNIKKINEYRVVIEKITITNGGYTGFRYFQVLLTNIVKNNYEKLNIQHIELIQDVYKILVSRKDDFTGIDETIWFFLNSDMERIEELYNSMF